MLKSRAQLTYLEIGVAFDSYFECITSCYGISGEDTECVTECVAIHLDEEHELALDK